MTTEQIDRQDPQQYQLQLDNKISRFKQTMAEAGIAIGDIAVHESAPLGFRMRAEFRIWHQDGQVYYAMNRRGEKRPHIIADFPIGGPLISQFMPGFRGPKHQCKSKPKMFFRGIFNHY